MKITYINVLKHHDNPKEDSILVISVQILWVRKLGKKD